METNNITILPSNEVRKEPDTKLHSKVFNAFWIVFCGIPFVVLNAVLGIAYCCTLLGIPAGIMCFKYIPFIFHPAGREWKLYYGKHPILNTMNFIFGGFETYVIQMIIGIILCVSLIGIPLGLQYFKAANFHLAPFGAKVQVANSYTEELDHSSDYFQLRMQMRLEDKIVKLSNGQTCSASYAMLGITDQKERQYLADGNAIGQAKATPVEGIGAALFASLFVQMIVVLIAFIIYITGIKADYTIDVFLSIVGYSSFWHAVYLPIAFTMFIAFQVSVSRAFKVFKKKLRNLTTYYPKQYDAKAVNKLLWNSKR